MAKRVEVMILNQLFTFVGEDEEKIQHVAQFVDGRVRDVVKDFGIINTMNAVIMAMMQVSDEYLELKRRAETVEDRTVRLLRKVENI